MSQKVMFITTKLSWKQESSLFPYWFAGYCSIHFFKLSIQSKSIRFRINNPNLFIILDNITIHIQDPILKMNCLIQKPIYLIGLKL